MELNPHKIRRHIKQQRKQLTSTEKAIYDKQIFAQLIRFLPFIKAKNIALPLSFGGEVDTFNILNYSLMQRKNCYCPSILFFKPRSMCWTQVRFNSLLIKNRWHIWEPKIMARNTRPLSFFDFIITPLVAFDTSGNRLGLGGGFYDTAFSKQQWKQPLKVALAYEMQKVEWLATNVWDEKLDYVITEKTIYKF